MTDQRGVRPPDFEERLRRLLASSSTVAGLREPVVARLDRVDIALVAVVGRPAAAPVLFVGYWGARIYVGPDWKPGTRGCPRCLALRVAGLGLEASREVVEAPRFGTGLAPGVLRLVQELVEVRRTGDGSELPDVHVVDGLTGSVQATPLLPDSLCPGCAESQLPTELTSSASDAEHLTDLSGGGFRGAPLVEVAARVEGTSRGEAGFFRAVLIDLQSPLGACSIELPERYGRREPAIGRAADYASAQTVAVLEGLERYCGLYGGRSRRSVRATYAEVAGRAVDPRDLGLHPDPSYTSDFLYHRFDPDVRIDWVSTTSFSRRDPVLVPERNVFYGPRSDGWTGFVFETSSGCALGSSPEEAVLHGVRELAERDAFLMTWYRRLALPEVALGSVPSPELQCLLVRAAEFTGFRFRAFLSTMEYRIPSVWMVAEGQDPEGPQVLAGGASHFTLQRALLAALQELVGLVLAVQHSYRSRRADGEPMLEDPFRVLQMRDHALVNSLPEARDRFAFLLDRDERPRPLAELTGDDLVHSDMARQLESVVTRLAYCDLEVLGVDQTVPEVRDLGLWCARAVVPGLLPVTFGHRNRRTVGLPRLEAPASRLPYTVVRDSYASPTDTLPHPFP